MLSLSSGSRRIFGSLSQGKEASRKLLAIEDSSWRIGCRYQYVETIVSIKGKKDHKGRIVSSIVNLLLKNFYTVGFEALADECLENISYEPGSAPSQR